MLDYCRHGGGDDRVACADAPGRAWRARRPGWRRARSSTSDRRRRPTARRRCRPSRRSPRASGRRSGAARPRRGPDRRSTRRARPVVRRRSRRRADRRTCRRSGSTTAVSPAEHVVLDPPHHAVGLVAAGPSPGANACVESARPSTMGSAQLDRRRSTSSSAGRAAASSSASRCRRSRAGAVAGVSVHVVASSSTVTSIHSPGITGAGRADVAAGSAGQQPRWVRSSMPRVTSADVPSGKHVAELDATWPTEPSTADPQRAPALPSTSARSATGQSYISDRASSARWSSGWPHGSAPAHEIHAATPTSPRTASRSSASVAVRSGTTPWRRPGGGHVGEIAPHARVERRGRARARRARARTPAPALGRASARRAGARRRRRSSRGRGRCAGRAGRGAGHMWLHGPAAAATAPSRSTLDRAERVVAVPVGPAGDEHRRARDALVPGAVRARAGSSRGATSGHRPGRASQSSSHGWRLVDAPPPLVTPAVAAHRRHRRQRVHRDHVERVVDEVDRPEHAAACSGRRRCSGRRWRRWRRWRRARGRPSAAIWSELNPEYDVPNIPTRPFDHGCAASHSITRPRSARSTSGYSSVVDPVRRSGAAHVEPAAPQTRPRPRSGA